MTDKRPTPETDAVDGKPTWQEDVIEKGWVPADIARRLERERDEARERADTMFAKHAEILDQYRRERDSERALADRLGKMLELYCVNDDIAHHAGIANALATWREARGE